jgi:DNA-binding CsgD family transcriptional regulator
MQSNEAQAGGGDGGERRAFILSRISARQFECLRWAQEGKSASDIGAILKISPRTVENHFFRACETLGVKTRIQAVIRLRTLGLLGDDHP